MDELEARALENAKTVEGWTVEKQARYEQFMQAEKAAEDRRQANVQHTELQPEPVHEIEKIDPWEAILVNVDGEPFHDEMRVHSQDIMTETLGIAVDDQNGQRRLAECMRKLGWMGPKQMRIHSRSGRGFWRAVADNADTTLNAPADSA
jgi:hypothetical protein